MKPATSLPLATISGSNPSASSRSLIQRFSKKLTKESRESTEKDPEGSFSVSSLLSLVKNFTHTPPKSRLLNHFSKQKKPFLLLEILISILIVSLCLIPLIERPIQAYREERRLLEEMERERLSEWSFSEVKEQLLNREIPWDRIPSKNEKTARFSLPDATLEIPGIKQRKIERSFTLRCTGEKEGKKGEEYRLLQVDILFNPPLKGIKGKKRRKDKSSYRTIVQKL